MLASLKPALRTWMALPAIALVAIAASTTLRGVRAQNETDESSQTSTPAPYAEVQYATLTGTTNTINLTMLPVVLSNGSVVYKNVTVPLEVSESKTGAVTLTTGTLNVVSAPPGQTNGFRAGNYVGPGAPSRPKLS